MTQTIKQKTTPWLVPVGAASDIEHKEFTLACRGHVQIGKVLGYLIAAASWQESHSGGDVTTCEVVELADITHKKILAQVKISQNSLTTYLKQLATWGYIQADSYRHTYRVYPQKINEAVTTPPPLLEKKPRGKHAPPKVLSAESQKYEREQEITKLRKQLTKLGTQFTNLGNRITTLRNKITNLGIENLCEEALEQAFMGDSQGRDIEDRIRYKEILEDSLVVSALAETDAVGISSLLSKLSSFEEYLEDVQHQENGHTNGKAPLDLSASPREEVRQEELQVDMLPDCTTSEPTERVTEPLTESPTQQREIPVLSILTVSSEDNGETPSPGKTVGKGDSKTFEQREAKQLAIRQNKRKKIIREAGFTEEQERTYEKWEIFYHERCGGAPVEERAFYADVNTLVKLVKKFSDRQLGMLDTYFTKEHFKWKQPTWQHQLGAMRVWEEHQSAIAYLTSKGRWTDGSTAATSPPDDSFSCIPEGYNAADEFGEYYGISEKREVEYAAV